MRDVVVWSGVYGLRHALLAARKRGLMPRPPLEYGQGPASMSHLERSHENKLSRLLDSERRGEREGSSELLAAVCSRCCYEKHLLKRRGSTELLMGRRRILLMRLGETPCLGHV